MRNGLFIACQIGNGRVKDVPTEMVAEFPAIDVVVLASLLEPGDQVAQQLQMRIVVVADIPDGLGDLHDTLRPPVGRFQRDDREVGRSQCGESGQ